MKIIHLTDLHLGKSVGDTVIDVDHLRQKLTAIETRFFKSSTFESLDYLLLLTGDIADAPVVARWNEVSELLQEFRGRWNIPILVLPGNHDLKDYSLVDLIVEGDATVHENLCLFQQTFAWTFESVRENWQIIEAPKFDLDYFFRIDRFRSIAGDLYLICLDSMVGDEFMANGMFGSEQLAHLAQHLADLNLNPPDKLALAFHHSPYYNCVGMKIDDLDALVRTLQGSRQNVQALFFGHTHLGHTYQSQGVNSTLDWKIPNSFDGGCLFNDTPIWIERMVDLFSCGKSNGPHAQSLCRVIDLWDPNQLIELV